VEKIEFAGTIMTWTAKGVGERSVEDIRAALKAADLEKESSLAKEFSPRNAFTRACRKLSEDNVIQAIQDDEESDEVRFQFNRRLKKEDAKFDYPYNCDVILNKETGAIYCDVPAMKERAEMLFSKASKTYSGSDVTNLTRKVIDRLFGKNQMIPISPGVFFVTVNHEDAVGKVDRFLTCVGARPKFFEVPLTKMVKENIAESVDRHFDLIVKDYEEKIKEIEAKGVDASGRLLKGAEADLTAIEVALKGYAEFRGDRHAGLVEVLKDCEGRLDKAVGEKEKAKAEAKAVAV
jgi:hypothetical protein